MEGCSRCILQPQPSRSSRNLVWGSQPCGGIQSVYSTAQAVEAIQETRPGFYTCGGGMQSVYSTASAV